MFDGVPDEKPYGRQHDMPAVGCLGRVLMWYYTRGSSARKFAMIFGQTSTPMYKYLKFSGKVLLFALIHDVDARIAHLTNEEVRFNQRAIGN